MRIPSLLIATTLGLLVGVVASGCGSDDAGGGGSAGSTAGSGGATGGTGGATGGTGGATGGAAGATGGTGGATGGAAGTAGTAGTAGEGGEGGSSGGNCMAAVDLSNFALAQFDATQGAIFVAEVAPNVDEADPEAFQLEFWADETGSKSLTSAGVNDNYETCMQCALLRTDVVDAATNRYFFQSAGTIDIDATAGPMSGGLKATITDLTLSEVTIDMTTYVSTPVANGACITVNGPVEIDIAPPPPPPDGWTCDASYYGAADGCDCDCGAWDVDCDDTTQTIYNCQAGQSCVDPGVCDGLPTGWTCDAALFDDGANCNCECGAFDPDCADDTLPIVGCDAGDTCGTGVCLPADWTCLAAYYADGTDCDCECGAWDPDCDTATTAPYNCQAGQTCIDPGVCDGLPTAWTCDATAFADGANCNCECGAFDPDCADDTLPINGCQTGETCGVGVCVPAGWTCNEAYYGDTEYCDCGCGAWDPDCDDAALPIDGCQTGETCVDPGVCQ